MVKRHHPSYTPRSVRRLEKNHKKRLLTIVVITIFLAYFLLSWGLPALINSLTVFNQFKPANNKKIAVEDAAITPPILNIPFEATNSAAIKISGYAQPSSKVEIYVDDELKNVAATKNDGSFISEDIEMTLGTNNIYGKTVLEEQSQNSTPKKSLASKTIKVIYNNEKPKLELEQPQEGQQIKGGDKKIRVSGTTDPEDSITVNGNTVIVNNEGKFSTESPLNDGDNTIMVVATNKVGNTTQVERKVNYSSTP